MIKHIRYASDLHLEGFLGRHMNDIEKIFLPKDDRDPASILILAGDICSNPEYLLEFLKHIEYRFRKVIFFPGNHEYYRHHITQWNEEFDSAAARVLTNTEYATGEVAFEEYCDDNDEDHVRIIFGTLWGDGGKSLTEQGNVGLCLNDFRLIEIGDGFGRRFTVPDMMEIHKAQKAEIEKFLQIPWLGTTVVATHHLPSYSLCHPRFGDVINGGFAANCEDLIEKYKPHYWIHGHTHDTINTVIGQTRVLCNPRGYRGEWDTDFNTYKEKFIDL